MLYRLLRGLSVFRLRSKNIVAIRPSLFQKFQPHFCRDKMYQPTAPKHYGLHTINPQLPATMMYQPLVMYQPPGADDARIVSAALGIFHNYQVPSMYHQPPFVYQHQPPIVHQHQPPATFTPTTTFQQPAPSKKIKIKCQACKRTGHLAAECHWRREPRNSQRAPLVIRPPRRRRNRFRTPCYVPEADNESDKK